jgi:hypothetical protein
MLPRTEALRGPTLAFRSRPNVRLLGSPRTLWEKSGTPEGARTLWEKLGAPVVPRTLWENLLTVGLPYLGAPFGPGVAKEGRDVLSCKRRTGDSGRGRDGRGPLPVGDAARPGPTDWLNLGSDGVGGV